MRFALALCALLTLPCAQGQPAPRLDLHGDVQADARAVWGQTDASTFLIRRARLLVDAALDDRFRVRVMPDVAGSRVELLDAFVEGRVATGVTVRAGKFKAPVGLERLRRPTDLDLPERAFPTQLVPNRDVGVMVRLAPGRQTVEVAVTNGVADGASGDADPDAARDLAARVLLRPVRTGGLAGLAVGIAATTGVGRGTDAAPQVPAFQTPGRQAAFAYTAPTAADGARTRLAPQAFWTAGPLSAMGEWVASRQHVRRGDAAAALTQRAWQVTALAVLTGEDASYGAVRPRRPFAPETGQWGAVAVAARVHRLALDPGAFPAFADPAASVQAATAAALGLDWWLTDAVRLQLGAERTVFTAPAGGEARPSETALIGRVQLVY